MQHISIKHIGFMLVCHGLNCRPENMNDLVGFFQEQNYLTENIELIGHKAKKIELWSNIHLEDFQNDLKEKYLRAQHNAKNLGLDFYVCAYSISAGLIHQLILSEDNLVLPKKIVYLAPAFKLRTIKNFLHAFKLFPDRFLLPSLNLKSYRIHRGTSLGAYRALLKLENQISVLHKKRIEKQINYSIPTLVLIDPKDELISYQGLMKIFSGDIFSNIKIKAINKKLDLLKWNGNHHLIIDKFSLNNDQWENMKSILTLHLK